MFKIEMIQKKIEALIPQDKALHVIGGNVTYCVVRVIGGFFVSREVSIIIACLIVLIVAIGKELIIDKLVRKKDPEMGDVVATCLGSMPSLMMDII